MEEVYLQRPVSPTNSHSEEAAEVHGSQPPRGNTTDQSYYNGTAQGRWFPDPVPHGNHRGYPPQGYPHQQTRRQPIYSGHGRPSNSSEYSSVGMSSSSTSSEEAGMLPSKSKSHRRRCSCGRILVVIAVVIIALGVGAFLGMYYLSPPSFSTTGDETEFCMPCEELILSSAPADDYSKTFHKKKVTVDGETREMCCMEDGNTAQLEAYIKAKAEEQIRQDDINGVPLVRKMALSWQRGNQTTPPKAMATLFATDTQVVNESVKEKLQTINYTLAANKAFKYDGIQWDQSRERFIILFAGVYDVSSHVSFVRDASSTSSESVLFVHKVMRENRGYNGGPETLTQEIQEKECPVASRSDVSCHTSTLLAAYDLRAKDEIFVQVSRPDLLQTGATTFIRIQKVG